MELAATPQVGREVDQGGGQGRVGRMWVAGLLGAQGGHHAAVQAQRSLGLAQIRAGPRSGIEHPVPVCFRQHAGAQGAQARHRRLGDLQGGVALPKLGQAVGQ